MIPYNNPGPGTMICPTHGNVWLHRANPVLSGAITLSSDCEYEVRCGICGEKLTAGIVLEKEATA